jgi:hypothetical protein
VGSTSCRCGCHAGRIPGSSLHLKDMKRTRLLGRGEAATQFSSVIPICTDMWAICPGARLPHLASCSCAPIGPHHPLLPTLPRTCPSRRRTTTTWARLVLPDRPSLLRVSLDRPLLCRVVPLGTRPCPRSPCHAAPPRSFLQLAPTLLPQSGRGGKLQAETTPIGVHSACSQI